MSGTGFMGQKTQPLQPTVSKHWRKRSPKDQASIPLGPPHCADNNTTYMHTVVNRSRNWRARGKRYSMLSGLELGRPAGNSASWGEGRNCQGRYTHLETIWTMMLILRAPNKVWTNRMEIRLVFDNPRERVEHCSRSCLWGSAPSQNLKILNFPKTLKMVAWK